MSSCIRKGTKMSNWILRVIGDDGVERRQHWRITESVHTNGRVFLNLVRKGKVKTVRVR